MIPKDPDPILDFDFDNNANASSRTHLSYNHDASPPHSPSSREHTYTPQDDGDIDAIHTVPSSRPTLHDLRIPTSSHAVPGNTSEDRGEYRAFVPMATPKPQRKPAPPLIEIYAGSKPISEKRRDADRERDWSHDPFKLQKQIRNLLALIVLLLLIMIMMMIPIIYLTARTWVFASSNVSAFTADGQGTSRGLPGLMADIANKAANATRTDIGDPVKSLGNWAQEMSGWANATSAQLKGMDAGGLNGMVKTAVSGVDGVNKRFDDMLDKLVVVGVNGTGEIWSR
ncbi:uncharacterized protein BDZ99DRAFT_474091 [Mytilinidion resinicola]|uniref:Uncharacterized protein n=1 Tax=Mytilinidion resinicola TaxID=574789 RepID=A0A6A6YZJ9_9PEZI|nr:uncharacterized protein BDZ99DRAFT_474091 [Mytilinidion resinicola]KAF2813434.1 hypothetical protein BDZ99DRAFT_474091 [Mytilinidion resinicola]